MLVLKEKNFFNNQIIYTSINDVPSTIPHQHEFIEIFYVINGTAKHFINDKVFTLTPGDLYILRPNDKHYFKPISTQPLLHRNFFVTLAEFCRICDFIHPNLSNLLLNHHQIIKTTTNTPAINCFEQQLQLFSGTSTFWAILIEILSSIMSSSHPNKQIFPHWIQQLLPFLDKPDTFKKNLHELIENIPLSFSYICTEFKKHLGVSITEYRKNAKLQYAYSLILTSNLSINQIYEQCGFISRAYFYKAFKEKYGIIPGSLRKS